MLWTPQAWLAGTATSVQIVRRIKSMNLNYCSHFMYSHQSKLSWIKDDEAGIFFEKSIQNANVNGSYPRKIKHFGEFFFYYLQIPRWEIKPMSLSFLSVFMWINPDFQMRKSYYHNISPLFMHILYYNGMSTNPYEIKEK